MPAPTPLPDRSRIATLDALRGVAVMGILLLNIVDFAMPGYAYFDPNYYGGATGANWWAWASVYVLADGKMRGLFTMLFGASTLLIAGRALAASESPARVHYARMTTLLGIGMIHAWLIWSGDILVLYALCGAIVFIARRWPTRLMIGVAIALMAWKLAVGVHDYHAAQRFEAAATSPVASPALRADWARFRDDLAPPRSTVPAELAAYRGGWAEVLPARFAFTGFMQRHVLPTMLPDTLALMLIGMALFRGGFFSGAWPRRRYWQIALTGYAVTTPLYIALAAWIDRGAFDPVRLLLSEPLHLVLLRPWMAIAHAALVILFVTSGRAPWLAVRLAAAGRMAFSNYLGTSIVCTWLFCGYGLGWFGHLDRWQLYPVVLAIWAAIMLWSKPWLDRFAFGPFEWLWRSLARGRPQRFRRNFATANDPQ